MLFALTFAVLVSADYFNDFWCYSLSDGNGWEFLFGNGSTTAPAVFGQQGAFAHVRIIVDAFHLPVLFISASRTNDTRPLFICADVPGGRPGGAIFKGWDRDEDALQGLHVLASYGYDTTGELGTRACFVALHLSTGHYFAILIYRTTWSHVDVQYVIVGVDMEDWFRRT